MARRLTLVVDASCLFEVVAETPASEAVRQRLADDEHPAPHVIDVRVFGIIRDHHRRGRLDDTAASQAVEDLRDWPGERFPHRPLLDRAWRLRATIRGWDAMYVALGELFDATLATSDRRLASAPGPGCPIEVL